MKKTIPAAATASSSQPLYADGAIRWQRLSDGEELLALFVHAKDRRYIP